MSRGHHVLIGACNPMPMLCPLHVFRPWVLLLYPRMIELEAFDRDPGILDSDHCFFGD